MVSHNTVDYITVHYNIQYTVLRVHNVQYCTYTVCTYVPELRGSSCTVYSVYVHDAKRISDSSFASGKHQTTPTFPIDECYSALF